jgi:Fe-S cluster assembly iron-binding protein IscA
MKKIKIKIYTNAYNEILNLLNFHDDCNCIRLKIAEGCCKSSKVELTLDSKNDNDFCEIIDNLYICYDQELLDNVDALTIALNKSNFYIKAEMSLKGTHNNKCSKKCSSNGCNSTHKCCK